MVRGTCCVYPGTARQWLVPVLFGLLILVFPGHAGAKFHPGIHWQEISNQRFVVVFPAEYREEARYALDTAQELYESLSRFWKTRVREGGKIRILLTDAEDNANGSATFFPYNRVEIRLYTPPPDSPLGSGRDWIRMVLSHELTHILNLNAGSGMTYFLRRILGSNPIFYPILYMPDFLLEGLAIYGESWLNGGGRLNAPDYRLMLGHIAATGDMLDLRQLWGTPSQWPGPTSEYLYGAAFVQFLEEQYGHRKIHQLIDIFATKPVPVIIRKKFEIKILTIRNRFKEVFGKNIRVLWLDFLRWLREQPPPVTVRDSGIRMLTTNGLYKEYPVITADNTVFYANRNYTEYPGISRLDLDDPDRPSKPQRLIKRAGINGMSYDPRGHRVYFSAVDYYKSYYRYSDLYRLDVNTGNVKRLSRGKRLSYPVKDPVGDGIYCVKRVKARSHLALLTPGNGGPMTETILSRDYEGLAYPAVSPDGRLVAVSIKRKNKPWAVALFDRQGQLVNIPTEGWDKCYAPAWRNTGELWFLCREGDHYRPASITINPDLSIGDIHVYRRFNGGPLQGEIPSLRFFSFRPGGNIMVASFFDGPGFNLGLLPPESLQKGTPSPPQPIAESTGASLSSTSRPESRSNPKTRSYRFWRDLTPKYFSAGYRNGGDEMQPGIYLDGEDLTGRHHFSAVGYYGFESKTLGGSLTYTYDGFYPTLSLRYWDLSDLNHGGATPGGHFIYNEKRLQLEMLYPLWTRTRRRLLLYSDLHFETSGHRLVHRGQVDKMKLNGVQLGLFYSSARRYYDSISFSDGVQFSLSYSRRLRALGSDYNFGTAAVEYKQYCPLFRPGTLALRMGYADSRGEARRIFYMGGADTHTGFHLADNNLFDLMRGYPSGYFAGTSGYIINLEYRLFLLHIERVFLVFKSIDRLYLSVFADLGQMWMEPRHRVVNPAYSIGAELNLVVLFGDGRFNVAGGVARGRNPDHGPVYYLRIGNSF